MQNAEIYYVAVVKDDYVCGLVAGPFFDSSDAEQAVPSLDTTGLGRCSYQVVKQTIQVEIVN